MSNADYIYGMHAVIHLLRHDADSVVTVLLDNKRRDERAGDIVRLAKQAGVTLQRIKASAFPDAVQSARHQGVVARVRAAVAKTEDDLKTILDGLDKSAIPALLLVLDGVQDPHNLGACLRSAEAAGVHAVIVPKDRACGITATVRKVAAGAVETVPVIRVTNLVRTLRHLQQQGIWLYGTALTNSAVPYYQADLKAACAIVMGAEGEGLRRLTAETCDQLITIPMAGAIESLNVSVSAGICLFEAVRQRQA